MLNHCTMDDLLAVRDGEGSGAARRHVDRCTACQQELDLLHQRVAALKALPPLGAPRDRWGVVRVRIEADRRRRRWVRVRWASMAAAALLTLAVGGRSLMDRRRLADREQDVAQFQRESERLEDELRRFDPTSRVLNSTAASAIAGLEDGIAVIDERLAQPTPRALNDEMVRLWRQRVDLMDRLVDVHVSRANYVGL